MVQLAGQADDVAKPVEVSRTVVFDAPTPRCCFDALVAHSVDLGRRDKAASAWYVADADA
jgi:hypothetical protein